MARDPDPLREGERWLMGCEHPAACILAFQPVPQLGARVYALVARARVADDVEELAVDFGITPHEARLLMIHWHAWPEIERLARRARSRQLRSQAPPPRPSFIELSQPKEGR